MKKYLAMAVALAMLTGCSKEVVDEEFGEIVISGKGTRDITFNLKGDLTFSSMTRALTADGKDMTDVWVFDCDDNELLQQVHQTSEDANFGSPTLSLSYGIHYIYVVASRGTGATVSIPDETIVFGRVLDTFWGCYTMTVDAATDNTHNIRLDRAVTKLKVTFTDAIPDNVATFNVTPATWYYGLNFVTGNPVEAVNDQPFVINVPSSSIGVSGVAVNIFGFSSSTEWTTDVEVSSKKSNGDVISSVTLSDAPFKRNRVTEYSGTMWTAGGSFNITLNTAWNDSYTGTW